MLRFVRALALICVATILANAECMAQCSVRMCLSNPQQQPSGHCHHHSGKSSNTPPCPHQQAFTKSASFWLPITNAAAIALEPAGDVMSVAAALQGASFPDLKHPPPISPPDLSSLFVLRV